MDNERTNSMWLKKRDRGADLRAAVAGVFGSSPDLAIEALATFSEDQWRKSYLWLDASGMALYLIDRLVHLKKEHVLPVDVATRLLTNREDNRARTEDLLCEMRSIHFGMLEHGVRFAHLKGLSLCPEAVPHPELRCQLDLDFVVAAEDVLRAMRALEANGYRLHAVSGSTWEFKTPVAGVPSIRDLYKPKPHRSAELHLVSWKGDAADAGHSLSRVEWRKIGGVEMPVLSGPDIFVGQAMHLLKHICGEFTRISWLLEFARHMEARRNDLAFWKEVEAVSRGQKAKEISIGIACLLAEEIFQAEVPKVLRCWTVESLPRSYSLWVEEYGRRALMADFPGGKLFLLLAEAQALAGLAAESTLRKRLVPFRLPPSITVPRANRSLTDSIRSCRTQMSFVLFRARFHLLEGLRCALELPRWQKKLREISH